MITKEDINKNQEQMLFMVKKSNWNTYIVNVL